MLHVPGRASLRALPLPLRRAAFPALGVLFGALALWNPVVLGVLAVGAVGALLVLRRPGVATDFVLFGLYSNAVTVLVRYHHVPKVAGMAFPALLLLPLLARVVVRREPLVLTRALPWIALLICAAGVSAAFSRSPGTAWEEFLVFLFEGLALYFLVTNAVTTPAELRRATWALLAAGCLMGGVPAYQQVTRTFENNYGGFGQVSTGMGFRTGEVGDEGEVMQRRLAGPIGEKNRFSQVMLMLVPLGIFRVLGEKERRLKLLAAGMTVFALIGFVLPFSRGGAVGLAAVLVGMVAFGVLRGKRLLWTAAAGAAILACLPQYWTRVASLKSIAGFFQDVETESNTPDGAIKGRTTEVLAALLVYADHPLIGVGPGVFPDYSQEYGNRLGIRRLDTGRQAHSLFPGLAAELGTFGVLALLGAMVTTLLELLRTRQELAGKDPDGVLDATAWILVLVSYLVTGVFLHLSYARYLFLVLALAAAAVRPPAARVLATRPPGPKVIGEGG